MVEQVLSDRQSLKNLKPEPSQLSLGADPGNHQQLRRLIGAGVKVTIELVEDTVHSFVLFDFLPETRSALEQFATHAASALPEGSRPVV